MSSSFSGQSASGVARKPPHSEATPPPADREEERAGWKHRGVLWGLLALVVLAGLLVPRLFSSSGGAGGEAAQGQGSEALRVSGYVVEPQALDDRILTTGTLRANEEVELVSETSGRVTGIYFEEGSRVARGQLLLRINDAELQAERERLQYEVALAEQREERQRQLLERGGVSQEEYDDVRNRVNVLRAEEQLLEARIEKTRVHAPFSGTIGLRNVSEGDYLSQQSRIATLRSIQPIKIDFTIPERYAGRVQDGQEIVFQVEGIERPFRGTIYAIEPSISASTRALELRAEAPNTDGRLLPGAFASIEVVFDRIEGALVVPSVAVLAEREGAQVFVVENGQAQRRSVRTGIRTDSTVQVVEGLSPQDTVLTSSLQQLRAGQPVQVEALEDLPDEMELEDHIEATQEGGGQQAEGRAPSSLPEGDS